MSTLISTGTVQCAPASVFSYVYPEVSWEFGKDPAEISWGGIRYGHDEAIGFFVGIAAEHADRTLEVTMFLESSDAVAAFGRYAATVKATGVRVDSPVAHLFQFRDGEVVGRSIS